MITVGIIIADDNEYEPFLERMKGLSCTQEIRHSRHRAEAVVNGAVRVVAVLCGIGKVNAATATAFLINEEKPQYVFNIGLSGAVSAVRRGETVAGSEYTECDFDITPTGRALGEKPSQEWKYRADDELLAFAAQAGVTHSGKFGTGDFFLTDFVRRDMFRDVFGICAFDMESAAVASVCHAEKVPFLAVRKMSDNADDTAVDDYRETDVKCESDLTDILFSVFDFIFQKSVDKNGCV